MVFWIASAAGLAVAYLLGATPTGYLAGRLVNGIDVREHGSRSVGATNVLRTVGKWPALVVLLVDLAKGGAAVVFARWFYPWLYTLPALMPPTGLGPHILTPWAVSLAGLAVLLGHSRSIWLNFAGGKSAATGLGVLLALSWPVFLGAAAVVGVVLAAFRIVSLSSIAGRPDRHRPDLRLRPLAARPPAGDRRRPLHHRPPPRQHRPPARRNRTPHRAEQPGAGGWIVNPGCTSDSSSRRPSSTPAAALEIFGQRESLVMLGIPGGIEQGHRPRRGHLRQCAHVRI